MNFPLLYLRQGALKWGYNRMFNEWNFFRIGNIQDASQPLGNTPHFKRH